MGTLIERNAGILARIENLSPLRERIQRRFYEGNRAAVLAGLTRDGSPVAPLRPSTVQRRQGNGPPRAPSGPNARIITAFVVAVNVSAAGLVVTGGWPSFEASKHLNNGTRYMPPRPAGWRPEDVAYATAELKRYVMGG